MKTEEWKYCVDIRFDEASPHPNGIRMYYNDFKIAAERMMTFGQIDSLYDPLYKELAGDRRISEMKLLLTKDGSVEAERRLEHNGFGDRAAGLYYHFPNGITDFEKKSGFSFAGYKGYDSRSAFIQTSYTDSNSGYYKDFIAHESMIENLSQERRDNGYFTATISRQYFATRFPDKMNTHPLPFNEVFFSKDPDVAVKILMETDFNQLDKSVAWEKELDSFIVRASMGSNGREHGTVKSYRRHFHHDVIKTPGIYLELSSFLEERLFLLKDISKPDDLREIYKAGHYNELGTSAEKVPELVKALDGISQERRSVDRQTQSPVRKRTIASSPKQRSKSRKI